MKTNATKNSVTENSELHHPFFAKTGGENFFSKTSEPVSNFFTSSTVQPKLAIGQPNDKYEQEADAMAEHVVNSEKANVSAGNGQSSMKSTGSSSIQRLSSQSSPSLGDAVEVKEEGAATGQVQPLREEEENSKDKLISRKSAGSSSIQRLSSQSSPSLGDAVEVKEEEAGTGVQPLREPEGGNKDPLISTKQLDNNKHSGKALDTKTQSFMESRFGNDFSNVKIHDNSESAELATSINARAFAHGSDIYFNKGEYKPEATEGKRTLAHELTHVVQQGGTGKAKSAAPAIQRLGGLLNQIASGIAPWGAGGPVGTDYEVATNAGSAVRAWVAYSPYKDELSYWCHGHSLGTYAAYGYSVYSGPPLQQVITDEWTNINPANAQPGDIAVWTTGFDHSAKFVNPVITNGTIDPNASMLSSKNGQNPLGTMSLSTIIGIYGGAGIAVFRHN